MDATDRLVLASALAASLGGAGPAAARGLPPAEAASRLAALEAAGLVAPGGGGLTPRGRASLRVVLSGGVFDIIHPGHVHTLAEARALGDALVVVVATDGTAERMKGRAPLHAQGQRRRLVEALSDVDACLVGDEGDMFRTVARVRPQVIALGYDQAHQEGPIAERCRRMGLDVEVARLRSPVPGISSSEIESEYGSAIHGI